MRYNTHSSSHAKTISLVGTEPKNERQRVREKKTALLTQIYARIHQSSYDGTLVTRRKKSKTIYEIKEKRKHTRASMQNDTGS